MARTYYDVLGVPASADQDAIDRAWRERVKETHPDQNDDPNAAEQFLTVKEAYDVLGDPEERERYDRLGHDQYMDSGGATGGADQSTQDAYSREGASSASASSAGGSANESFDWTAHTRGSQAAEDVWSDYDPTESAAESATATDWGKRIAAYAIVAIPLGFVSPVLFSSLLGLVTDTQAEPPVAGTAAVLGLVVVVGLLFVGTVAVAEHVLGADRRLLDRLRELRPQ
jgi:hypothetical protein